MAGLRFGTFMAPFHHPAGQNPSTALQRDLEILQHMDRLGFDEAWIGEHHSAGAELVPSPEVFIAWAAAQTKRIKLGTGVLSLTYHNPFMAADRVLLLSQLLRDRLLIGLGPGALPSDAEMIGVDPRDQREMFLEDVDVFMHLLTSDEPITRKSSYGRYNLVNARSQLRLTAPPDVCFTSIVTPAGPMLAGKHGGNLLSVGGTSEAGFEALASTWKVLEDTAAQNGHVADRSKWRLAGLMHLAETKEQAIEDVKYGLDEFARYTQEVIAAPFFRAAGTNFEERVAWVNETGLGVIGTPEEMVKQIKRLDDKSGGFGCYLEIAHEWARHDATKRSLELFADWVMPEFSGTGRGTKLSEEWATSQQAGQETRAQAGIDQFNVAHPGGIVAPATRPA